MSSQQKPPEPIPHHKEHLETTALGVTLVSGWDQFKQGKLISYRAMGISLIVAAVIGVGIYIWFERKNQSSQLWMELENANSLTALEEFAKKNPNTVPGRVAEMDRVRMLLGPDGMDKLPSARDESEYKRAVENIDTARELMTKLLEQSKDDPIYKVECLVGMASSEEAFIGVNKDGSATEFKGTIEKLIEWLDKLAEAADGTPWGDEAKKRSASLKSGSKVRDELTTVQRSVYGKNFTGFPAGGGPLTPGKDPFGPIPGLPGGPFTPQPPTVPPVTPPTTPGITPPGPVPPTMPPTVTPMIPVPKPPEKTPDPKPPEKTTDPKPPEKGPIPTKK